MRREGRSHTLNFDFGGGQKLERGEKAEEDSHLFRGCPQARVARGGFKLVCAYRNLMKIRLTEREKKVEGGRIVFVRKPSHL